MDIGHLATAVPARRPCGDMHAAADAALELFDALSVAERSGRKVAMAHGGLCWLGHVGGSWEPAASDYQGGRAREFEAMVRVTASGECAAAFPVVPTPAASAGGRAATDGTACGIERAFAAVPGMLVIAYGPNRAIVADRAVKCRPARLQDRDVLVLDFQRDDGPVAWPGCAVPTPPRRTDRDPYSWQEVLLGTMELCLEAGLLDRVGFFLRGRQAASVSACGDMVDGVRLADVREGFAAATAFERRGGAGTMVDPTHPMTLWVAENEAFKARLDLIRRQGQA